MNRLKDKYIECADKTKVYFAERDPDLYIDKIILLYGSTGSGKSTILKDILYMLRKKISIAIAFCPTNFVNNDYENIIPESLIYKEVDPAVVEEIYRTQEYRSRLYKVANNPNVLRTLFNKIASSHEKMAARIIVDQANFLIRGLETNNKLDAGQKINEKKAIEHKRDKSLMIHFKKCIRKHKNKLRELDLREYEAIAFKYLDMNPHIVLIFDDCLSSAAKWKNTEVFKALFMQGRQYFITQIYTLQDNVGIPPGLRTQAQISIFTAQGSVISHFSSKNNGYGNDDKKAADKISRRIFTQERGLAKNHQKMIYEKFSENPYKVTIADVHDGDFKLGSRYLWKYIDELPYKDKDRDKLKTNKDYLKDL